ncbi:hypothetical protein [Sinorhizobium fredii]|uniref:hypothetical protein n=1 Tax=Rhizobium fredii TaxID=380 RepID=UPI001FCA5E85|nr:hypothetical protein [Sinorhizobium fredii]
MVLIRESVTPRSMFFTLISDRPAAWARSVCFQPIKALEEFKPNLHCPAVWSAEGLAIGQLVSSGDILAVVTDISRSAAGREQYDMQELGADYGTPHRTFLGDALVAAD